jgi:hypothetical protein
MMTRFVVLPSNLCAVFDRTEGRTFNVDSAKKAHELCELLETQHQVISKGDNRVCTALRYALEDLVSAKDYKDNFGKDSRYEFDKEEAWKKAREALSLWKNL